MNASFSKRLMSLALLTTVTLAAFWGVGAWLGQTAATPGTATAAAEPATMPPGVGSAPKGIYYLATDTAVAVDAAQFIYKGYAAQDRIRIDVVIPDLDPETAYVHLIDIGEARTGFTLLGRRYRLTAVNQHRIRMVHHAPRTS